MKTNYSKLSRFLLIAILPASLTLHSCAKDDEEIKDDNKPSTKSTVTLFATTNTGANFTQFDVTNIADISVKNLITLNVDADGINYNKSLDFVAQVNRTEDKVDVYGNISNTQTGTAITPTFSSTSNFTNGRELVMTDNKIVVAEDADGANKLVVYNYTAAGITLDKIFDVSINLWGITIDNNTLYAVQDNSDTLAVFENFFSQPAGTLAPTFKVQVEGIVRTHGLTYDASTDVMFLTNIGDAGSATDGGIHIVKNFNAILSLAETSGKIDATSQIVIEGTNSMLGNPVDIAYDNKNNKIYVAERAVDGGRILGFNMPSSSGNIAPIYSGLYPGASSVSISY